MLLLVLFVIGGPGRVSAQMMIMEGAEGSAPQQGFTVATDEALQNSFGDFQRHVERKAWEKAIATLNEIPAEKRKGMLARPDGVIIPASQRIWDAVADLPAEGRDAFRLFHEAKARQTWARVDEPGTKRAEQLATADKVYQEFFLTSVGDNAADFLGDAAFERGDFENADRFWRNVLEKHPDSDVPEARLLFKRGLAVAQLAQATTLGTIVRSLEQRFAGQKMKVGGKDVAPADYLHSRLKAAEAARASVKNTQEDSVAGAPPAETKPAWRMQFLSPKAALQRESSMRSYSYYRNGVETVVPAVASDGNRVYANWFGIVFAIDVASGKLVWRSQKFGDITQHFGQMSYSANPEAYRLATGSGIVLSLHVPVERLNHGQEPSRLVCFEAETGKVKWKSMDSGAPLSSLGFVGKPLIEEGEILVLSHGQQDAKLSMCCLDLDGKQKWTAELGSVRKRSTISGYQRMPQPALLRKGRTVYIASEDGALAAFDLLDRKIRWLLPYGSPDVSQGQRRIYYSGQTDSRTQLHTETALLEQDGLVYVKEAGGRELLAIDPSVPSVVWRRPAEEASQLVGIDADSVYLMDHELCCIDRKDRTLRWATNLPITTGGLSMVSGPQSILILTGRGVFQLSRANGKVTHIFRGADLASGGGHLTVVGDRLVAVTTQSVTSYPVPQADQAATGQKESQ
ncbi:outer membrane biogenesis protein BamB [Caulifigura coniformis]|uniref:Outer membrane biogenesis protein BamB n=1 Tax=Caulifigura coniformis TaxID=2527983 RepID=A0A517SL74_9PLAN|nr:PQQ-binding-like beta-propeller repeat protein [Caulifigura coniformis]QDT56870.1 outer membrane biogenesis protein BamB [Caulifigura coniformis]